MHSIVSATDGGGHAYGPHGDHEREVIIPRTSQRMDILLTILEEAGVLPSQPAAGVENVEQMRQALVDGASFAAVTAGHTLDTAGLVPFARWVTPRAEQRLAVTTTLKPPAVCGLRLPT